MLTLSFYPLCLRYEPNHLRRSPLKVESRHLYHAPRASFSRAGRHRRTMSLVAPRFRQLSFAVEKCANTLSISPQKPIPPPHPISSVAARDSSLHPVSAKRDLQDPDTNPHSLLSFQSCLHYFSSFLPTCSFAARSPLTSHSNTTFSIHHGLAAFRTHRAVCRRALLSTLHLFPSNPSPSPLYSVEYLCVRPRP